MPFAKIMAKQLREPSGLFSQFVARAMNRTNVSINESTAQLLEIKPTDCVLEIGFGGTTKRVDYVESLYNCLFCHI